MNRKYFISSIVTAGAALSTLKGQAIPSTNENIGRNKTPPFLNPGDTIGITSPAGYISLAEIQPSVQLMESWGFKIQVKKILHTEAPMKKGLQTFSKCWITPILKPLCAPGVDMVWWGSSINLISSNLLHSLNGSSGLAMLPYCIAISTAISALPHYTLKCVTAFPTTGQRLNPFKLLPFYP